MNRHKNYLREIAKFASGLMFGDFLMGIWLMTSGMAQTKFMGITFAVPTIIAWMIFDIVVVAILVHYGWHAEVHNPTIKQRNFFIIIGILLSIVMIAHLLRALFNVNLSIGLWMVPIWLSWVAFVVTGFLAYTSFVFATKK